MTDPERDIARLRAELKRLDEVLGLRIKTLEVLMRPARQETLMDEPKKSLLATLVERQTSASLLGVFNRTVDNLASELAQDILRDPAFREELRTLMRAAFEQALKELKEPAPPGSDKRWP